MRSFTTNIVIFGKFFGEYIMCCGMANISYVVWRIDHVLYGVYMMHGVYITCCSCQELCESVPSLPEVVMMMIHSKRTCLCSVELMTISE